MSVRTSVLVIVDTLAEISAVDVSAPVVFCMETGKLHVKNGNWASAFAADLNGKCNANDPRLSNARPPLAHGHEVDDLSGLNKSAVGLANVDNTADVDKPVSTASAAALAAKQNALAALVEAPNMQRIFTSPLSSTAAFLLVSGVAYFVYIGRVMQNITPKFVEFHVSTAGAGGQVAEVGLFSSPNPPNKTAQTFTKIVATGTVDALNSTGVKRNTAAFAQAISPGTHLWAAIRTQMATTQPQIWGLGLDMGQGFVQSKASSGALTGLTTVVANLIAAGTGAGAPNLRVAMD
jgi:hypothetical protein